MAGGEVYICKIQSSLVFWSANNEFVQDKYIGHYRLAVRRYLRVLFTSLVIPLPPEPTAA